VNVVFGILLLRPSEAALPDGDAQDFERTRRERRHWASCDNFDVDCGARVGRDEDERRETGARRGFHRSSAPRSDLDPPG